MSEVEVLAYIGIAVAFLVAQWFWLIWGTGYNLVLIGDSAIYVAFTVFTGVYRPEPKLVWIGITMAVLGVVGPLVYLAVQTLTALYKAAHSKQIR